MPESIFDRKKRVRPPRVHITYEVETRGATEKKEIPFVMGVLADLSGKPEQPLPAVKDRKFVEIDRDNFNEVLAMATPRLALRVENTLTEDGKDLSMVLNFKKLADFRPEGVAAQVEPLAKLLEVRNQLKDLLGRLEGNDRLEELLEAITNKAELRETLGKALQPAEAKAEGE